MDNNKFKFDPDQLVIYTVVNTELGMDAGKIAGQCQHAMRRVTDQEAHRTEYKQWVGNEDAPDETKLVLAGKQKDLEKLAEFGWIAVRDNGKTQIPAGSLTVVTSGVVRRGEVYSQIKRLQLLGNRHLKS